MDRRKEELGIVRRTIDGARTVDAPAEDVWDLLRDTRRWPEWGPSLTDVECSDRRIRNGSSGRVRVLGAAWVPFEVTYCDAYRWTWKVAGIPATGHRVEPLNGSCRAVFEVPLFAAGYAPVCRLALSRIARLPSGYQRNPSCSAGGESGLVGSPSATSGSLYAPGATSFAESG